VAIAVTHDGEVARIVVADQGIGIAASDLDRLFQRFERMVSVRHYGGIGLGLWITRQIVEALGGTIAVESTIGVGTTFTVALPIAGPPAQTSEPATPSGLSL
jgi:signal transduction histidine kinase